MKKPTHWKNISELLTLASAYKKDGRRLQPGDLDIIADASLVFDAEKIVWVGPSAELPEDYRALDSIPMQGKSVTPEIVDSHTHLVFGGNRAKEYAMRLNGATYEDIAKMGGGILNTMNGTLALNAGELFELARHRVERLHSLGVGTIEIKSGYGLTFEKEYELSHVINRLKKHFKDRVQIFNTYLAAHAVPKSYASSSHYISDVVMPLLEKLAQDNILDAVDIFHESNYFDSTDVRTLFDRAKTLGLATKIHADEFADNDGAVLASEYQSLSADHLMKTGDEGIRRLSDSNTVATLLPGTSFFLGKPLAPGRRFLDFGCKIAIASDYNPGSCHIDNVLLAAQMAAPQYKMNLAELWASITLNAAHALNFRQQGALVKGLSARFSVFKSSSINEISYFWGHNLNQSIL